ncbi:MAG: 50S ribosomal protein L29 [Bacillota bacterium]
MKMKEVHELNEEELDKKVKELKEELFNLRFQQATGQLDNMMRIKEVRRNIARVKTVLRERALS